MIGHSFFPSSYLVFTFTCCVLPFVHIIIEKLKILQKKYLLKEQIEIENFQNNGELNILAIISKIATLANDYTFLQ